MVNAFCSGCKYSIIGLNAANYSTKCAFWDLKVDDNSKASLLLSSQGSDNEVGCFLRSTRVAQTLTQLVVIL